MSHSLRLRPSSRGLLLAAISAAFAHTAMANTGRVDFTAGTVTVTDSNGGARQLAKGNEVKTGDRIVSEASGRAQIRFSDGSYVSLQPNTDFSITNYAYDGKSDGLEKAFFNLVKGAMRTVTGLVGRRNRDAYQLSTPTATIGIRGTGGVISVATDGSTLVQGTSGVWTLTTAGGSLEIPAGRAGTATDPGKPPQQTSQGPNVPAPSSESKQQKTFSADDKTSSSSNAFSSGENRTETGSTDLGSGRKTLVSGTGYAVASTAGSTAALGVPVSATFDDDSRMTSFVHGATTNTLKGSTDDFGTKDGIIAWGRWTSPVSVNGTSTTYPSGFHYVVGLPTAAASLPTGATYSYSLMGSTKPTTSDGSATGSLNSATLNGNFSSNVVNVNFTGSISGKSFNATINGMSLNTGTASFSGSGNSTNFATGANTLNNSSSTLAVSGFFAGAGASNAGFSYSILTTVLGTGVVGVAALKR